MKTDIKTAAIIFLLVAISGAPAHASQDRHEGLWRTSDKKYVVAVSRCGDTLCGNIYWEDPAVNPLDVKNPDPEKRNTPLCGMNLLKGFKAAGDNKWKEGTIYRTETGDTYQATLEVLPSRNVVVRGFILAPIFGQSEILTPVDANSVPPCKVKKTDVTRSAQN